MSIINLLALDPGLATCGAVVAMVPPPRTDAFAADAQVFTSEPRGEDYGISAARDLQRRARDFADWLHAVRGPHRIHAIVAEAMSFPRGARPITLISMAWGVITLFAHTLRVPIIDASPSHWRTELIGASSRSRTKAEIERRERAAHAEAVRRIPSLVRFVRALPRGVQKHALDAGGVLAWSLETRDVKELRCQ